MSYDPDKLESGVQNTDEVVDGEIVEISEGTAGDFYGEEAEEPDREAIEVTVHADVGEAVSEFTEIFSLPVGEVPHPSSKLAKFYNTYGHMPRGGSEVTAEFNDDGFLRIQYE